MVNFIHKIVLITVALLCGLSVSAYDFEMDGYRYNITSVADLTVEVVGTPIGRIENNRILGIKTTEEITIPSSVQYSSKTFRVTRIGKSALENADVKSVIVPEGIIAIGERAFYWCYNLESITLPSTLASIEGMAFCDCSKLKEVHISDLSAWCNITFDSYWGYENSNPLMKANNLYLNGSLISECVIPESVSEIKFAAFAGASFKSVSITSTVTDIGKSAFASTSIENISIPKSIKAINESTFYDCQRLTDIEIPSSVKTIAKNAFAHCVNLKTVKLWGNVNSIGEKAFNDCNQMTDIYCSAANPPTIKENTFSNMTYMFTNLHVPEGTNETYASADNWKNFITIVDDAQTAPITEFEIDGIRYEIISEHQVAVISKSGGSYSGDIVIPYKVELNSTDYFISAIGDNAFKGCQNLTSISLPVALNTIGKSAFAACHSLEKIVIPDAVYTIESDAFNPCYSLKEVTFGIHVKDIGTSAFRGSEELTRITCTSSEPPTLHEGVFSSKIYQTALVQIPKGSKAAYQTATEWKEFNAIVEEGEETGSYNSYLETGFTSENVTKDKWGNTRISVTVYIKNLGENTITLKKLVYKDPVTEKISYTQEFNTNSFNSGVLAAGATKEVSYSTQKTSSSYTYNRFWLEWYYEYKGNEYIFCSDPNDPLDVSPILSETDTTTIGIFDLNGKRISTLEKGINIIKYSDGTTKKVIVK
ncbi:MAG TPA: hypothetical protein DCG33_00490 [Prevotellaceae bacterium]|nr:hypothetical protein [Prevotellaceae bacterium]